LGGRSMIPSANRTKAFDRKFQAILESIRSQYGSSIKYDLSSKREAAVVQSEEKGRKSRVGAPLKRNTPLPISRKVG
jgi:hypothetical protein